MPSDNAGLRRLQFSGLAVLVVVIALAVGLSARASAGTSSRIAAPVKCSSCWRPGVRESWQIQLSSTPQRPYLKVAMIEADGFDTPASTVAALHRTFRGRGVVCYIDAGTWENWRPDARRFPRNLLGKPDGGWPGERWLDIARLHGALGRITTARARMCARKGFDAIDFDNVDGYTNPTGFHLSARDQLRYDVFLANTAHRLGLAVALRNDQQQIPVLVKYFDFAVDEQCFQYHECRALGRFVKAHKAVFEIEYKLRRSQFCQPAIHDHFNALRKGLDLGPWRQAC